MKRKRTNRTLFFWTETREQSSKRIKKDDPNTKLVTTGLQIELILKRGPIYQNSIPLPYEMLMKIFKNVIEFSDHPIRDLFNLARVCEDWRQIILTSPQLWSRIDLSRLPVTDGNISVLDKIFKISPKIIDYIKEVSFSGVLEFKDNKTSAFVEALIGAPNLTTLSFRDVKPKSKTFLPCSSICKCKKLRSLTITQSRPLFTNQKWITNYLMENGKQLEVLDLAMSLTAIPSTLFRTIRSDYCPNLKILDISTCDALTTHSFDTIQLTKNLPNLEVLRVGNVSFKRVYSAPEVPGLTKLRELSMPIAMRDADRDDALFATLTFGSDKISVLDLRGSSISAHALIEMPSYNVRELHMDDLCPITRKDYHRVISKWSHTLEVLSLVKINCSETVRSCLKALYNRTKRSLIRDLDLSSSDVTAKDLKEFLAAAQSLNSINLSSCRSLPRGCKGEYTKEPTDSSMQRLSLLKRKLK